MGKIDKMSMMRLVTIVKPESKTLMLAVATLGATTGISLVFPAAIGQILDVAIAPSTTMSHTTLSVGLLSLFIVQSSLIVVRSALLTIAGERLSAGIRRDLFKVILQQEIGWFDSQRTGDIMNRLSSDSIILQKSLTSNLSNGLRSVFMVVGGVGMLFYLSPSLAALSLSLIPPVSLAGMTYGRYVQGQQKAVQKSLGETMDVAQELISSVRTVRQHARERDEAARFDTRVDDSYIRSRRIGIVAAGFDGAIHMAANVSMVAVLFYGGSQVADGSMSAGDLTAFLMYSLYTGFNISNLR
jgi:ATP-binding cassette subfamily B (MDR/TAP) protein 10